MAEVQLFVGGCDKQGSETMGRILGTVLEGDVPAFLVALGKEVAASGMDYAAWSAANPDAIDRIAAPFLG